MTSDHTGPFNMGSPEEISMRELAEKVTALAGSDSAVEYLPLLHADDPKRRRPALDRIVEALGFAPRIDLTTGLTSTLAWFRQIAAAQ